ncbi:MAG: agmatinase family protein [Cyclobacteriaceae bacterium]|nr:agmatinase family protein [Cyclobacteriaceae bacterium HetDA_MAG_MS6]
MSVNEYDPSSVGVKGTLFGLPYTVPSADLVVIPVPWDVTASYGDGASTAPMAILHESPQLDLAIYGFHSPWLLRLAMEQIDEALLNQSKKLRESASVLIAEQEKGSNPEAHLFQEINEGCAEMVDWVYQSAKRFLEEGKICGTLGGDHSTPLGLMRALSDQLEFGILQIDAHMDLRQAYEGFDYSHASIMYHAIQLSGVQSLTQVGIRDFSLEEERYISKSSKPIHVFYDDHIKQLMFKGKTWSEWAKEIVSSLPANVYLSFDIDGLQPSLCPATGTPVPGGLTFEEAVFLVDEVVKSGRKIVGFDLSEVGNGKWDANVGARVLYRLAVNTGLSQGKL